MGNDIDVMSEVRVEVTELPVKVIKEVGVGLSLSVTLSVKGETPRGLLLKILKLVGLSELTVFSEPLVSFPILVIDTVSELPVKVINEVGVCLSLSVTLSVRGDTLRGLLLRVLRLAGLSGL